MSEIKVMNYIDGEFCEASGGQRIEDIGPVDGKIIATIPRSGADDVLRAVQSAKSIAKLLGANALQLQTLNAALNPMYQKMRANVMGKGDFYSQPTTRLNFVI